MWHVVNPTRLSSIPKSAPYQRSRRDVSTRSKRVGEVCHHHVTTISTTILKTILSMIYTTITASIFLPLLVSSLSASQSSPYWQLLSFLSPPAVLWKHQGDINGGASSQADFILNYFLSNLLSNSPFPPSPAGRLEQLMSPSKVPAFDHRDLLVLIIITTETILISNTNKMKTLPTTTKMKNLTRHHRPPLTTSICLALGHLHLLLKKRFRGRVQLRVEPLQSYSK